MQLMESVEDRTVIVKEAAGDILQDDASPKPAVEAKRERIDSLRGGEISRFAGDPAVPCSGY